MDYPLEIEVFAEAYILDHHEYFTTVFSDLPLLLCG